MCVKETLIPGLRDEKTPSRSNLIAQMKMFINICMQYTNVCILYYYYYIYPTHLIFYQHASTPTLQDSMDKVKKIEHYGKSFLADRSFAMEHLLN